MTEMKERYYFRKKSYEVPESKSLAPTSEKIISAVCENYGVSFNELQKTRRGVFNEPQNMAVYLLRSIRGDRLADIGKLFGIKAYSSVSSIIRRVAVLKKDDRKVVKRIDRIQKIITKGQT